MNYNTNKSLYTETRPKTRDNTTGYKKEDNFGQKVNKVKTT